MTWFVRKGGWTDLARSRLFPEDYIERSKRNLNLNNIMFIKTITEQGVKCLVNRI